jgi:hypothetical protein
MPGRTGFALLTQRWRTPQHVTASPGKIGQIARAALVLTLFEHKPPRRLTVARKEAIEEILGRPNPKR